MLRIIAMTMFPDSHVMNAGTLGAAWIAETICWGAIDATALSHPQGSIASMTEVIGLFPSPFFGMPGTLTCDRVTGLVGHFSATAVQSNNSSPKPPRTAITTTT